ncbi:hypothetical protein KUTeg_006319 [Tegillarca granosa]|uniref:SSD domain-containing protein n=1 Tax=Tegillarca granosa TaxID=220873 RepID=A0ABQ9FKU6_TEGGR|nr:hypothetical protein KUTeg_006319 [Tegillarca granosa]
MLTSEQTGECLKRTGVSVLLTSISNMLAFFSAAIIPIPALRSFSLQAGILIFFNLASVLLVYPAICSWDLKRRDDKRIDIFCCFQSFENKNMVIELQPRSREFEMHEQSPPPTYSPPPPRYSPSPPPSYNAVIMHNTVAQTALDGSHAITSLAHEGTPPPSPANSGSILSTLFGILNGIPGTNYLTTASSQQRLTVPDGISFRERFARVQRECLSTSLSSLATKYYGPFLQRTPVKVFTVLFFFILLILGIYGTTKVKDGLDLTDVVPKGTTEYSFLETQSKYFGFYNIYLVTKGGFDYPNNQNLLYEYHRAFQSVGNIIKREDGSMPTFWLSQFRQWLQELQKAFDKDKSAGNLNQDGWNSNCSHDGILAYKLIIQTGDIDNPIDRQRIKLFTYVHQNRLVDSNGLVSQDAFYNYLTAWVTNDALVYAASMADLHPKPKDWIHDPFDRDFNIPKAQPLIYTQLPFYLTNLSTTEAILDTIIAIRSICDTYSNKGLPNYPSGIPFTFWEQYINLRFYLMLAILCVLFVTFVVLTIVLMNPWLASIVVVVLTVILVELFGFMGLSEIKLSAIPAVILIVTVGIGVEFTVHISVILICKCLGFLTAIGSRNKRMVMSLEHTFAPVVHGAISTLLGIVMLVGAEFDFIINLKQELSLSGHVMRVYGASGTLKVQANCRLTLVLINCTLRITTTTGKQGTNEHINSMQNTRLDGSRNLRNTVIKTRLLLLNMIIQIKTIKHDYSNKNYSPLSCPQALQMYQMIALYVYLIKDDLEQLSKDTTAPWKVLDPCVQVYVGELPAAEQAPFLVQEYEGFVPSEVHVRVIVLPSLTWPLDGDEVMVALKDVYWLQDELNIFIRFVTDFYKINKLVLFTFYNRFPPGQKNSKTDGAAVMTGKLNGPGEPSQIFTPFLQNVIFGIGLPDAEQFNIMESPVMREIVFPTTLAI